MKITQLNLLAFGPFTNTLLDLSDGDQGLHVIYGANEAGKSAALRALRNILYGIPDRSLDNFVHPYTKLRIGATLVHSNGTPLEFIRRKGRVNTLRAADDKNLVDESELIRFLGGVSAELFATMFGIDHPDLVRGGKEIIKGGGTLGQILFAAGAGISNLREVQNELQSEADLLFRPSGQKPRINDALAKFRMNQKELRDAQLPDKEWAGHDQALHRALESKRVVDQNLTEKQRAVHRLERIGEALPAIARRKELLEDLKSFADVVLLPEGFGERRRELLADLRISENDRDQAHQSIEKIDEDLGALEISESILENADLIEQLYKDLGGHQKAVKDHTKLLTQRDLLRGEAKEILSGLRKDLTLDQAAKLRLKRAEAVRIQKLGTQYERLVTKLEGARDQIRKLSPKIEGLEKQIQGLEDPLQTDHLKGILEGALKYGALEEDCHIEYAEIQNAQDSLEINLNKQTLWSGSLQELEKLPTPSLETIDAFEDRFSEAQGKVDQLNSAINDLEESIVEVQGQIEQLRMEQEVPTEEELQDARGKREQGWQLVRRALESEQQSDEDTKDLVSSFQPATRLAEAYELSVKQADELADRLRREADRVAKKAGLYAEQDTQKTKCDLLRSQLEGAQTKWEETEKEWSSLWEATGLSPRSPREMRAWVQDQKALAEQISKIRERKAKADGLRARIKTHRQKINECLCALEEPPAEEKEALYDLIERSKRLIGQQEKYQTKKDRLLSDKEQRQKELEEARSGAEKIEGDLSNWQDQWEKAVQPLGLDSDAIPAQANAVIDDLKSLFDTLKDADNLNKRIKGIERDAEEFTRKVTNLTKHVAQDLAELSVEQAAAELNGRLKRTRTAETQKQGLEKQRQQEESKLDQAKGSIAETESELAGMCEEAGCSHRDELPEAEKRSTQRRQIETELENLEEQLRKLSAGATIEAFVQEAKEVDPDSIGTQIDHLTEEIDALNKKKSDLDQTIGEERNELKKMDGSAKAAELAEDTQMLLGRLETDVEQYARLKLATTILSQAIERYREKHQAPVLKRATEFFAQLTVGSFQGIRAEFDEQGRPVLVGVRPGGKEIVDVEGMSDGSADQLYFALRLASLEEYLDKNESIPFIVDDILMRFDNDRATAALQVLGELSKRTQVIFFTHHQHLLELAEANVDASVLFKHALVA